MCLCIHIYIYTHIYMCAIRRLKVTLKFLLSMTIYVQAEKTSVSVHAQYLNTSRRRAVRQEMQAGWVCMMETGERLFTSELSVPLNLPASEPCLFPPYNLSFLPERRVTTKSKLNSPPALHDSRKHRHTPFAHPSNSAKLKPNQNNT